MVSADNTAAREWFCIAQGFYCGDIVAAIHASPRPTLTTAMPAAPELRNLEAIGVGVAEDIAADLAGDPDKTIPGSEILSYLNVRTVPDETNPGNFANAKPRLLIAERIALHL
jgi:hypothetical protein